jgi:hypothetical protein
MQSKTEVAGASHVYYGTAKADFPSLYVIVPPNLTGSCSGADTRDRSPDPGCDTQHWSEHGRIDVPFIHRRITIVPG